MSKGNVRQHWQRYITFADSGITQLMHQIAFLYIVVPKQKWNNTYLKTAHKLEKGNISNICFQDKELRKIKAFKFF